MILCCKDCQKRHPACHGSCPEYLKEKAEHEAEREQRNREIYIQNQLYQQIETGVRKKQRHNRRTWNAFKEQQ